MKIRECESGNATLQGSIEGGNMTHKGSKNTEEEEVRSEYGTEEEGKSRGRRRWE